MGFAAFLVPTFILTVAVLEPLDNRVAWLVVTAAYTLLLAQRVIKFSTADAIAAGGAAYLCALGLAHSGSPEVMLRELRMLSYLHFGFKISQVIDWRQWARLSYLSAVAICLIYVLDGHEIIRFWPYREVSEYQEYRTQGPSLIMTFFLLVFSGFKRLRLFELSILSAAGLYVAYLSGSLQTLVTIFVLITFSLPRLAWLSKSKSRRCALLVLGITAFIVIYFLAAQSISRGNWSASPDGPNSHVAKIYQLTNITSSGTFQTRALDTAQSFARLASDPATMVMGRGIGFNTIVVRVHRDNGTETEREFLEVDNGWIYILNRAGLIGLIAIAALMLKIALDNKRGPEGMKILICIVITNFLSIHMFSAATIAVLLGAYFAKKRSAHIPRT